jgi:D-serine deaminase-like pyridoxal phosphate-dependent protein
MNAITDINQLPTPAVIVDLPTVRRNIASMAGYCRSHGFKLRPHAKTHKSLRIGQMQMEAGAIGLTVAKADEAAVMAGATDDVLVAYPAFDAPRAAILAELARIKMVRVSVDSTHAVDHLAEAARSAGTTIGILVDLDVGFHRTGVQSSDAALALAQHVDQTNDVRLDGIMFFPGHVFLPASAQEKPLADVSALLQETIQLWTRHGLSTSIVSGGSTPTARQSHHVAGLTEIRPGTYVYYDANCVAGGWCQLEDCAARVVCTVVSTAVERKCVIDAGSKTMTSDRRFDAPDTAGFGLLVDMPLARVSRLSEEHGEIELRGEAVPKLGSRITLIPNHICPCINLHDRIWFREDDGRFTRGVIDARGKIH